MKMLTELLPDVEAGKVAMRIDEKARLFKSPTGDYVFAFGDCRNGYVAAATLDTLMTDVLPKVASSLRPDIDCDEWEDALKHVTDHKYAYSYYDGPLYGHIEMLLSTPLWQTLDASPSDIAPGKSLCELYKELLAGEKITPVFLEADMDPHYIQRDEAGPCIAWHMSDGAVEYASTNELYSGPIFAHAPMWCVGESPAYLAAVEKLNEEKKQHEAAAAALASAPPRTVEMSEVEYREYTAWRACKESNGEDAPF